MATTTTTTIEAPVGPVTAPLNFYSPPADGSKPHNYVEPQPAPTPQRNFGTHTLPIPIADLRGSEPSFTLDANAFEAWSGVLTPAVQTTDWTDDASVKRVYYPAVEALLLAKVPGSTRVFLFDHTVRRAEPNAHRAPVQRVHIDQTAASAAQRVRTHLPAEAETLLKGRYRIINVWVPLNPPVVTFPLAVCDSATVRGEDLVPVEHRYPDRTGETAAVRHAEGQRWYYWSGMREGEALALECFDSQREGGRVPHTAFEDGRTLGGKGRESVEVRALVFG